MGCGNIKYNIIICAFDSARENIDVWIRVSPKPKFPAAPGEKFDLWGRSAKRGRRFNGAYAEWFARQDKRFFCFPLRLIFLLYGDFEDFTRSLFAEIKFSWKLCLLWHRTSVTGNTTKGPLANPCERELLILVIRKWFGFLISIYFPDDGRRHQHEVDTNIN